MLSRDEILAADDLPTETVTVKSWGGEVRVRALSGAEMEEFSTWQETAKPGKVLAMAGYIAMSVVDAKGERVFTLEDAPALAKKSQKALADVFKAAMKLAGAVQEALKGK
jgi:hypothetical protein